MNKTSLLLALCALNLTSLALAVHNESGINLARLLDAIYESKATLISGSNSVRDTHSDSDKARYKQMAQRAKERAKLDESEMEQYLNDAHTLPQSAFHKGLNDRKRTVDAFLYKLIIEYNALRSMVRECTENGKISNQPALSLSPDAQKQRDFMQTEVPHFCSCENPDLYASAEITRQMRNYLHGEYSKLN